MSAIILCWHDGTDNPCVSKVMLGERPQGGGGGGGGRVNGAEQ